jgi:sulfur-oxidizing protein SoxX
MFIETRIGQLASSLLLVAAIGAAGATALHAEGVPKATHDAAVAAAWRNLTPDMQARIDQDQTMVDCSQTRNNPTPAMSDAILAREKATIVLPADGNFMGDWKKGEALSLNGAGGRMGDSPTRPNGGNCYACHEMAKKEISYGTLGPSLHGYGRLREFKPAAQKEAYEKIYNAQAVLACSNMPRFGANKFLTVEQIKDIVAFLMSPDSPVNK